MKFWEIPREKQLIILREDLSIKGRTALEFEYDLPKSHILYDSTMSISEMAFEPYISDKHKRRTLVAVLDCLSHKTLEARFQILNKWGIVVSLGRGEHIVCKNKNKTTDSNILYVDLESLTDIKFEEFHPYAQGTPARIQMLIAASMFLYTIYIL